MLTAHLATENGEFIIVLDSQDRENEGDLIIAAESITDAQMAFLVRYSRSVCGSPIFSPNLTSQQRPNLRSYNTIPRNPPRPPSNGNRKHRPQGHSLHNNNRLERPVHNNRDLRA